MKTRLFWISPNVVPERTWDVRKKLSSLVFSSVKPSPSNTDTQITRWWRGRKSNQLTWQGLVVSQVSQSNETTGIWTYGLARYICPVLARGCSCCQVHSISPTPSADNKREPEKLTVKNGILPLMSLFTTKLQAFESNERHECPMEEGHCCHQVSP